VALSTQLAGQPLAAEGWVLAGTIQINRAPVLTLWAAVVAERLGFERDEALTLGRALAGLTAHTKGIRLGIFEPASADEVRERRNQLEEGEQLEVRLLGRMIPVVRTPEGLRAAEKGKAGSPASVERYLRAKFGDAIGEVQEAMEALAASLPPAELARSAFSLYERFRPEVPSDERGWGVKATLNVERIRNAAQDQA
jgi:hypothetical protein